MKKTNILKAAIAILAGASLFTLVSCDNLNQLSEKESEKAYLRVSLSDEARTILPYSGVTEFTDFKLSYYDTDPDTGDDILTALGTTYASYAAFEKAEIELPKEFIDSSKTFKLEAKKGTLEFSATTFCTVTYGENNITFKLAPVTLGTGKGGFNYTLDFSKAKNARNVVSAYVSLYNSTNTSSNSYIDYWVFAGDEISGNKIVVAKDQLIVPENDPEAEAEYPYAAGSYQIKVILYADEDSNLPVIYWSDTIQVAAGQVSTGSSEVSSLNEVYTLTLNTNGGTALDPVKVTIFTEPFSFSLPTATKEGNLFVGWYEDSNFTTPFVYTTGSVTENKTLYAKFLPKTNSDDSYNATASNLYSILNEIRTNTESTVGTQSNPVTVKLAGVYNLTSVKNALSNNSTVYVNLDLSQAENITSLNNAFNGRSNLTGVTLPASCTSVDTNTFYSCSNLSSITVDSANAAYKSVDGVLYTKDGTTLIKYPAKKAVTSFVIPSSVKIIYKYAFQNASNISSITLSETRTNLYYYSSLNNSEYQVVTNYSKYNMITLNVTTFILNNTGTYYFYPSDKASADDFVETVTVYTPATCNTASLNISDGTYTIVTESGYKYNIVTEVGKVYTINWCDEYNRAHKYAYKIDGNDWSGFEDCHITLTDSTDSTFTYQAAGGNPISSGSYNDDNSPITFNGNGHTITITVNGAKCAFRVWAQPTSSGSGE